ncbi:hypothetical protein [Actinoallomurus sp. CA-150999]|uniref:hypothetical protein n=1 Tax=Actinoallomurus sp. CA-150999 TaxID=3239887 RepID=UPI003D9178FF
MSSIPRTGSLLAAVALTGTVFLAGCGGAKGDDATPATPSTAASTKASQPTQAVYNDPMDVAKKIKKARLGCTKPRRTESLGSGKVICGGTQNVSVEFYKTPQDFKAVKKTLCQMSSASTIVADEGQRWMVTSFSAVLNKRIQHAVGGHVVKVC